MQSNLAHDMHAPSSPRHRKPNIRDLHTMLRKAIPTEPDTRTLIANFRSALDEASAASRRAYQFPNVPYPRVRYGTHHRPGLPEEPIFATTVEELREKRDLHIRGLEGFFGGASHAAETVAKVRRNFDVLIEDLSEQWRAYEAAKEECGLKAAEAEASRTWKAQDKAAVALLSHVPASLGEAAAAAEMLLAQLKQGFWGEEDMKRFLRALAKAA